MRSELGVTGKSSPMRQGPQHSPLCFSDHFLFMQLPALRREKAGMGMMRWASAVGEDDGAGWTGGCSRGCELKGVGIV